MEANAKWLRELSVESRAYFCIYLWSWFGLCLSMKAYILAYWGGWKVHPLCLMKSVELGMCDTIRQELMTSEAQERIPIKITWPNLRLCSIKYGLWNCCLMLRYWKYSWGCIIQRSNTLNLIIVTFLVFKILNLLLKREFWRQCCTRLLQCLTSAVLECTDLFKIYGSYKLCC